MIRSILTSCALVCAIAATAQIQINPQIGAIFQNLTEAPEGAEFKAKAGMMLGCDFRVGGERFKFQPGFFFVRSATLVQGTDTGGVSIESDLIRSSVKVKALVSYNVVHKDGFKLRLNLGPAYDILLSVDQKDEEIGWTEDDYNTGVWSFDGGLGMDVWFLSLEAGSSFGLTQVFKDNPAVDAIDSKYFGWYATIGVVIGNGMAP